MNMNMTTLSRVVFAPVQRTLLAGRTPSFGWSLSKRTFIGTTTCNIPYKVAIVGSGPSGCYTAKYLKAAWDKLESNSNCHQTHEIDVLERLPTPYGLVRYGVAPDHPEVKNVQDDFDALFANNNDNSTSNSTTTIDYVGHVEVGRDVSLDTLRQRYHAVVVATGCQSDRRLGLPHEDAFANIVSAREFVAWYNGHPDFEAVRSVYSIWNTNDCILERERIERDTIPDTRIHGPTVHLLLYALEQHHKRSQHAAATTIKDSVYPCRSDR